MGKDSYKSAVITVTTEGTIITPVFDVNYVEIYAVDGEINFRLKSDNGWGDWVNLDSGNSYNLRFECSAVEIKSVTGSVEVKYVLTV